MDLNSVYNEVISKTLAEYDRRPTHWKNKLNEFISALDKKVD